MRKTRIIATLGPATGTPPDFTALLAAGANVFRLNCSHARPDWIRRVIPEIRAAARQQDLPVGILLDTQGPAIRTGDVFAPIPLSVGDEFVFTMRGDAVSGVKTTSVTYDDFARDVEVGRILLVDNGELMMRIRSKTDTRVECEVLNAGVMGSRRHINLPGVRVSLPALTAKDRADIALGLELGVDFIAQSFVRDPADVAELRALVRHTSQPPQLIAKIEHQFAVDHFEAIAEAADAIMVARGDLGIECPYEELPIIQRRIVKHCLQTGRPVIVATQMLESMIDHPLPTRAEITDVANAVFEQADAIMLSGETTTGWTNPDYRFTTGISSQDVTYTLQVDTAGVNFTSRGIQEMTIANSLDLPLTVKELNGFLSKMELKAGKAYNVEIRVKAALTNNSLPLYSNVIKITITPYLDFAVEPPGTAANNYNDGNLWIVGDASANGWNNPLPSPYDVSQKFTRVDVLHYEMIMTFNATGGYKLIQKQGEWSTQYHALDGTAKLEGSFEKKDSDPQFPSPGAGAYKVEVNFQTGKYKLTKQ